MKYDLGEGCAIEPCEYLGDYGCNKCGKDLCGHHLDNHVCEMEQS